MKNLASVQVITNLRPIEGADKIETATVLGWEVVVKKEEFKVGDKVAYIQIDTVLPDKPEYEFMRSRKFRVTTVRLKGQLSQGLIVPLPEGTLEEGDDLTDTLEIKKYEKPDNNPVRHANKKLSKKWYNRFKYNVLYKIFPFLHSPSTSPFPTHLVRITDEERIQNIPHVLKSHAGKEFVVSCKLDGSSITIIHERRFFKSRFRICSRRFELHDTNNDWHKTFEDTGFAEHIMKLVKRYKTDNIIVQGEAIGKFNGNHHRISGNQIRLFNIFVDGKRVNQRDLIHVCFSEGIPYCPMFKVVELNHTMEEILKLSETKDVLNPDVEMEGLVWRCTEDNLSFKVINNRYLLKKKE